MVERNSVAALALAAALLLPATGAAAQGVPFDLGKFPDWSGQWRVIGGNRWDASKPRGLGQQAPLTAEYQAILEASLADQEAGGQGSNLRYTCMPNGMPRQMNVLAGMEFVVAPTTTFILFENVMPRRIYTDGRSWPKEGEPDAEPALQGYSIGKWVDTDGDGKYDVFEVETRNFKGPRTYDQSGIPLHQDNASVIKERIFLDKADRNLLHDEVTTTDNALTRPWVVTKSYRRVAKPAWIEHICNESNNHIVVGTENYFISADGYLMPARKDQPPPDLRYFKQPAP
jgi:hypothetical protein